MISKTFLCRPINLLIQSRNYASGVKKADPKREVVNFYPRHPNHVDPPITPSKLFAVQRVKSYKGNPYWHKKILDSLKLNDRTSDIVVVKNTPEVCRQLWAIKHIIKVTPITLPDKLPEDDSKATILHENGDFLVAPKVDPERERLTIEHACNPKRLDGGTLTRELRMRWLLPYDL